LAKYLAGRTVQGLLIAVMSGGLFWLVWIYNNGLRDPRYLDGWVLAGGMSLLFTSASKRRACRRDPPRAGASSISSSVIC